MMPTLRDRIRHQQWQQETETATLSLAEIAERWVRLECGEGSSDSLVHEHLREIANQLSKSQQLRKRLERAVMPTHDVPAGTLHNRAVDPWQALHTMRDELRATAAGDEEAAAKLRFTDSMLRTCLNGSTSQPPIGLFPVPPAPQPRGSQPTERDIINDTEESLSLNSVEPESERADPDSLPPNVTRPRSEREMVNAHRNRAEAVMPACHEEHFLSPQQRGAQSTNMPYRDSEQFCVKLAEQMWQGDEQEDTDSRIYKNDMLLMLQRELASEGLRQPSNDVLWRWLTQADVVPNHARKPGPKGRKLTSR